MKSKTKRCSGRFTAERYEEIAELVRHYSATGEALPGLWQGLLDLWKFKRRSLERDFPHPEVAFYVACCRMPRWLRQPAVTKKLSGAAPRHIVYCLNCQFAGEYRRFKKMIIQRWQRDYKRPKLTRRQWLERRIDRAEDHPASQEFLKHVSDI